MSNFPNSMSAWPPVAPMIQTLAKDRELIVVFDCRIR